MFQEWTSVSSTQLFSCWSSATIDEKTQHSAKEHLPWRTIHSTQILPHNICIYCSKFISSSCGTTSDPDTRGCPGISLRGHSSLCLRIDGRFSCYYLETRIWQWTCSIRISSMRKACTRVNVDRYQAAWLGSPRDPLDIIRICQGPSFPHKIMHKSLALKGKWKGRETLVHELCSYGTGYTLQIQHCRVWFTNFMLHAWFLGVDLSKHVTDVVEVHVEWEAHSCSECKGLVLQHVCTFVQTCNVTFSRETARMYGGCSIYFWKACMIP